VSLPLQPTLRPASPRLRQLAVLCALIAAVLALGIAARPASPAPRLLTGGLQSPDSYARTVDRLIRTADQRLWLMLFVMHMGDGDDPVTGLCDALAEAAARGVDVRVVLDYGRDWETQEIEPKHEIPMRYLRERGVPVLIDELERTTHSKILLIDARQLVLGSHNWTRSALVRNRETSLLLHDPALVERLEQHFLDVPGFAALGR